MAGGLAAVLVLGSLLSSCEGCREASDRIDWAFQYDDRGRLETVVDPAGREVSFRYASDPSGRLRTVEKRLPSGQPVVARFDDGGRREALEDATGETHFRWDGFDRLVGVRWNDGTELARGYDTLGRLASVELGGARWRFAYDHLGRPERLSSPAGEIGYAYQTGQGFHVRTLPNGIRTIWTYGPDGGLESIDHVQPDDRLIGRFAYGYRDDGRIASIEEWSPAGTRTIRYTYDAAGRLASASDSRMGEVRFRWDPIGNRLEAALGGARTLSAYDWAGRLTEHGGERPDHDAAGNLASLPGSAGGRTFEYDGESRLTAAATPGTRVGYGYDGDGLLVRRSSGAGELRFYADPGGETWRPWRIADGSGRSTLYVWEGDVPLAAVSGGEVRYFLADHLGSNRIVVDPSGAVVERHDYMPFGLPLSSPPPGGPPAPGFAGLFYDAEAGLYLTRARGYDPILGRFLQREPAPPIPPASLPDLSAYLYAAGDPVNHRDASGLYPGWPPYNPNQQQWWWHPNWRFTHPEQLPWRQPDAFDRFVDTLSRYPHVNWEQEGQRALQQGHEREAHFYFGLEALGHGGQYTPVIGPVARHTTTLAFNPNATATDRLLAVGGLAWEAGAVPFLLRSWGGTILANVSRYPSSAVAESLRFQANTILTVANVVDWGSKAYSFGQAIPEVINAWRDDDRQVPFDGGPPGGGLPGTGTGGIDLLGPDTPFFPSDVGGIYLRGAGEALRELGPLAGIAVDHETGRWVLLAAERGEIELPPLRLDDLVTVLRSVYEQGEAPFVSIDPDPRDPRGPLMLVRHGALTEDTYVGWVLFEADRLMKAYSLGFDNVTREELGSAVEGYQDLLTLGFSDAEAGGQPTWERFWIVPARVDRAPAERTGLTLLDVPLRVRTQRMVMRGGKLEPAPGAEASAEAEAFASWFTRHYEEIAREARSLPPGELGATEPVEVFAELQRVALLAAIAELLRDQGVPSPAWLRQVEVAPVTVTPTTPAITVEATQTERQARAGGTVRTVERRLQIYGGVSLSPEDDAVRTVEAAPGARELGAKLLPAARRSPPLTPFPVEQGGRRYVATALPGSGFREVGGQRLSATDLEVPFGPGARIRLERRFNSFFRQSGLLGISWTLDLPRLETERRPLGRTGDAATYREVARLTSPLGSVAADLSESRWVPELGIETLAPPASVDILGLVSGDDARIRFPTRVVVFRDGRRWHFNPAGSLAARERGPQLEVFRYDDAGCLRRIEGWLGENLLADVVLECDGEGRLVSARGSNDDEVRYVFDAAGCLTRVEGPGDERWEYECDDSLVTRTVHNGGEPVRFEYGPRGTLHGRQTGGGPMAPLERTATDAGLEVALAGETGEKLLYDDALRPLHWRGGDGHEIRWSYPEGGGSEALERLPEGGEAAWRRTPGGDRESWTLPSGGTVEARLDGAGRIAELRLEDRLVARQDWTPAGLLAAADFESFSVRPVYRSDGVLEALQIFSPERTETGQWLELAYDPVGRLVGMTDGTGLALQLGHGPGGPRVVASSRGWAKVERDPEGRVTSVETSWGQREGYTYDPVSGALRSSEIHHGSEITRIELEDGRPTRVESGGGSYRLGYAGGRLVEVHLPDGLRLAYEHSKDGRVTAVGCGTGCRIEYDYDEAGRLIRMSQLPAGE